MPVEPIQVEILSSGLNILGILGCIFGVSGFLLSAFTLVRQRRNLCVRLDTAYTTGASLDDFFCRFIFSNRSSLPISVDNIALYSHRKCKSYPLGHKRLITTIPKSSLDDKKDQYLYSDLLPVSIPPYATVRLTIAFKSTGFTPYGCDYVSRPFDFWKCKVFTSRGIIKRKLSPPTSATLLNPGNEFIFPYVFDLPKQ